jgi:hypothetical protein
MGEANAEVGGLPPETQLPLSSIKTNPNQPRRTFDEAKLALDATDNFEMLLPDEEFFSSIDFSLDRSEEVRKAERND